MQKKQVNIREIAKVCHVSPATVSRAISGKAPVREETRLRIEQAIQDTGYQSRQEIRKRQTGRPKTIGVFLPIISHVFFQYVLVQLRDLLEARGDYMVILPEKGPEIVEQIKKLDLDGIVLLNEETSNISQGQKQLLTIARAILADNKILILDEATSSVDTRTEILIQKAMDNLMKGRTSFIIAHRLSTIRDANLILVMKDGDIIEQGTHEELLAKGGFYAQLYNSQFEKVTA